MTLYTLDINKKIKKFIIITIITLIFSIIYEYFSFGVYSKYMLFASLIPLLMGIIPYIIIKRKGNFNDCMMEDSLYTNGIITLTLGSLVQGVLEIYGTTNILVWIYPIVGVITIISAIALFVKKRK